MLNLENVTFRGGPRQQWRESCPNCVRGLDKHPEISEWKAILLETVNEVILGHVSVHCVSIPAQLQDLDKMITRLDFTNFITRCRTHAHLHPCKWFEISLLRMFLQNVNANNRDVLVWFLFRQYKESIQVFTGGLLSHVHITCFSSLLSPPCPLLCQKYGKKSL